MGVVSMIAVGLQLMTCCVCRRSSFSLPSTVPMEGGASAGRCPPPQGFASPMTAPALQQADSFILSLQQSAPSCPSAGLCPGSDRMDEVCASNFTNFLCTAAWPSGMVGTFNPSERREPLVQSAITASVREGCSDCASTMRIISIRNAPLL